MNIEQLLFLVIIAGLTLWGIVDWLRGRPVYPAGLFIIGIAIIFPVWLILENPSAGFGFLLGGFIVWLVMKD